MLPGRLRCPTNGSGLSERGQDRVVAGILAVVRVVPALGARHREPGGEHAAVDVDRQASERQRLDGIGRRCEHQPGRVRPDSALRSAASRRVTVRRLGSRRSPASRSTSGSPRRYSTCRSRRPPTSSIATTSKTIDAKRRSPRRGSRRSLCRKWPAKPALSQVPADQLEAGVRAQSLVPEHDPQVALDPRRETALSYPHWKWSFVREVFMVSQPENITTGRPLPVFSAPHRRAECPFRARRYRMTT